MLSLARHRKPQRRNASYKPATQEDTGYKSGLGGEVQAGEGGGDWSSMDGEG